MDITHIGQIEIDNNQVPKVKPDPSKHQLQVNLNKKLSNAIAALTKAEKKNWNELTQKEPSKDVFAFHFGTGTEDDYETLKNYLEQFGAFKLQLYPVKNYALIEFANVDQAINLMNKIVVSTENPQVNYITLDYANKQRYTMFFYSKVNSDQISQAQQTDIPNAKYNANIPGITLIKDFITEDEERLIQEFVEAQEWDRLNQRRVQHYGYTFLYGANTVNTDLPAQKPIPQFLEPLATNVSTLFGGKQDPVDQLTINEYNPGMGIPPHFDVHPPFGERFVSISLLSGLVMSFKSYRGEEQHLYLPARSCVLFEGEGRFAWFHSIASRKMDRVEGDMLFRRKRVSLTFRTIRKDNTCDCKFPFFCESQGYNPITMKNDNPALKKFLQQLNLQKNQDTQSSKFVPNKSEEETKMMQKVEDHQQDVPTDIEKKYVYEIYDKIAPHFSSTRYKPWPKIEAFLNSLEAGSIVADVGCGNGKYLHVNNENIHMVGTDRSENLIQICRDRSPKFQLFTADSLKLPLRSQGFDAVISIAVIHHFSNKFLRQSAIKELQRITKIGGQILIYVWAFEQEEKQFNEQDVFVPWNLQFKYEDNQILQPQQDQQQEPMEEQKQQQVGIQDYSINESKKTVVYKRYYHVFKKEEIEELIQELPGLEISQSYYGKYIQIIKNLDHANWVVLLKRII